MCLTSGRIDGVKFIVSLNVVCELNVSFLKCSLFFRYQFRSQKINCKTNRLQWNVLSFNPFDILSMLHSSFVVYFSAFLRHFFRSFFHIFCTLKVTCIFLLKTISELNAMFLNCTINWKCLWGAFFDGRCLISLDKWSQSVESTKAKSVHEIVSDGDFGRLFMMAAAAVGVKGCKKSSFSYEHFNESSIFEEREQSDEQ